MVKKRAPTHTKRHTTNNANKTNGRVERKRANKCTSTTVEIQMVHVYISGSKWKTRKKIGGS